MKRTGWKKGLLIGLCVILLLILLAVVFVFVYANYLLNRMNRVEPGKESTLSASQADEIMLEDPELETIDPNSSETYIDISDITFPTQNMEATQQTEPGVTQPEETVKPTEPQEDVYGDHLVNILLVGQDRKEGQGRQRSDSMILVSFNKSTNQITLTSFMRDQYVQIPGYKPNKLNAAYAFGGMSLLTRTLELNFGVKLDGIVEVDFNGFTDVIDLLGGVDINMTQKECAYFNAFTDWNLAAGVNHLSGEQALSYARLREIDSDYKRATRQRNVIQAVITAYRNQPLDKMLGLLDDILPMVTTNLSNNQILSYATDLFPMLATAQIETLRIPVDGTFRGGLVKVREGFAAWLQYDIDFAANKEILMDIFRPKE